MNRLQFSQSLWQNQLKCYKEHCVYIGFWTASGETSLGKNFDSWTVNWESMTTIAWRCSVIILLFISIAVKVNGQSRFGFATECRWRPRPNATTYGMHGPPMLTIHIKPGIGRALRNDFCTRLLAPPNYHHRMELQNMWMILSGQSWRFVGGLFVY